MGLVTKSLTMGEYLDQSRFCKLVLLVGPDCGLFGDARWLTLRAGCEMDHRAKHRIGIGIGIQRCPEGVDLYSCHDCGKRIHGG